MKFSINEWNDITSYLNGYVLKDIEFRNRQIWGVNSQDESFLLAEATPALWMAIPGKSFSAVDDLIREVQDQCRKNNLYSFEQKKELVREIFMTNIRLHNQNYKD